MAGIIYKGKAYKSETQMCKLNKLAYSTYSRRKERGLPLELCMAKGRVNIKSVDEIERYRVEGVVHTGIKSICEEYGISKNTLKKLEKELGSFDAAIRHHEEMLLLPIEPKKEKRKRFRPITVNGKTYKSISEACAELKLEYRRVYVRIHRKWTIDEAFELVERNGSREYALDQDESYKVKLREGFVVDGVPYKSIKQAAIENKIDPSTLGARIRNGMPIEVAIKEPVRRYERQAV